MTQASTHFPKERDDPTRSQLTPTLCFEVSLPSGNVLETKENIEEKKDMEI